jgi:hypothetical protein
MGPLAPPGLPFAERRGFASVTSACRAALFEGDVGAAAGGARGTGAAFGAFPRRTAAATAARRRTAM